VTTNALRTAVTILSENYLHYVCGVDSVGKRECVKKEELHENRKKKQLTRMGRRSNAREWKKKRTGKYKRKFKFLRYLLI